MDNDAIIAELENILEKMEIAADYCTRGMLRIDEAQKIIEEADQKILSELLHPDSLAFRIYEGSILERTLWWTGYDYVCQEDCENIEHRINTVRNVINEYEPEFLRGERSEKKQYFLSARDVYRAKRVLLSIMKRAKHSLVVVDPHLDEEIFDYIDSLDMSVDVKLITGNKKPMFQQLYNALKTTRSNIETKEHQDCHDRFLVLDDSDVWQLGTSINGVGKKASMLNKVIDSDEQNRFISDFNTLWTNGTNI